MLVDKEFSQVIRLYSKYSNFKTDIFTYRSTHIADKLDKIKKAIKGGEKEFGCVSNAKILETLYLCKNNEGDCVEKIINDRKKQIKVIKSVTGFNDIKIIIKCIEECGSNEQEILLNLQKPLLQNYHNKLSKINKKNQNIDNLFKKMITKIKADIANIDAIEVSL